MTLLRVEGRRERAAVDAISTIHRTDADRLLVEQLALVLARQTGARVQPGGIASDEDASPDVVVMSANDAIALARPLLDSGTSVAVVPSQLRAVARIACIGIAYDGSRPAELALERACALVAACAIAVEQVDVVHVDDSASGVGDAQEHVVDSRRSALIAWWLERIAHQVPAPVRIVRAAGDPAEELARISEQLDLLVVGTRSRSPLWRALTGSVSAELLRTTRCPLLVVSSKRTTGVSLGRDARTALAR
jgi:nucleotide-binding universal stress UspA family protein